MQQSLNLLHGPCLGVSARGRSLHIVRITRTWAGSPKYRCEGPAFDLGCTDISVNTVRYSAVLQETEFLTCGCTKTSTWPLGQLHLATISSSRSAQAPQNLSTTCGLYTSSPQRVGPALVMVTRCVEACILAAYSEHGCQDVRANLGCGEDGLTILANTCATGSEQQFSTNACLKADRVVACHALGSQCRRSDLNQNHLMLLCISSTQFSDLIPSAAVSSTTVLNRSHATTIPESQQAGSRAA